MVLRLLPLSERKFTNIFGVHVRTMAISEETKDGLCGNQDAISSVPCADELIINGGFSMRSGIGGTPWESVIGGPEVGSVT